ncbi:MAG: hypothetical protein ACI808_001398 [Paraglaciecola sp.]|jgi:hypothetical protein
MFRAPQLYSGELAIAFIAIFTQVLSVQVLRRLYILESYAKGVVEISN